MRWVCHAAVAAVNGDGGAVVVGYGGVDATEKNNGR